MKTAFLLAFAAAACAAERPIDTQKSRIHVHVYKTGVFSAFAHDHDVSAPVAKGAVDTDARRVEFQVAAAQLKVMDTKGAEKDHAEIQQTMLGPQVLDTARYPEISFRSSAAESAAGGIWKVSGSLSLHGETKPIVVEVRENAGHYLGSVNLKQTDFGIKPVRAGGGTVRVKYEVRIDFDIQLQ
jgi:polyisoprenoid-binding protein YceI